MALTRRQLRALNLDNDAIEAIIAAHADTVQALTQERDEALSRAEEAHRRQSETQAALEALQGVQEENLRLQSDFDAYRTQIELDRMQSARQAEIRRALQDAGANPKALELLCGAVRQEHVQWEENRIVNPKEALSPLMQLYADFFAPPVCLPAPEIAPPGEDQGPLSLGDVRRMSEDDIMRSWSTVRAALRQREPST